MDAPAGNVYYQLEVISPNLVSPTKMPTMLRSVTATYNSSRSNVAVGLLNALAEVDTELRLYPNPMREVLNIELEGSGSYVLMNLTGQVIDRGVLSGRTAVNTSMLQLGLYVVKVQVGTNYVFKKVMKAD